MKSWQRLTLTRLRAHYHQRWKLSLPSSGWSRVFFFRYGNQPEQFIISHESCLDIINSNIAHVMMVAHIIMMHFYTLLNDANSLINKKNSYIWQQELIPNNHCKHKYMTINYLDSCVKLSNSSIKLINSATTHQLSK